MKRFIFFVILCFLLFSGEIFSQSLTGLPQVRVDSMKSEVLNVTRYYSVYLPKSYHTQPEKKYPVLYLLHGLGGNNNSWIEGGQLQDIADRVFDVGNAGEMVIVVPDAGRVKDGYFDVEGWLYETFFFEEFVPFIEKNYRIIADKQHRAIAGFSMGGGGATAYAQKHSELFSSVYAMSALMTLPKQDRVPVMAPEMAEPGQSVLANDCVAYVAFTDEATLEKLRTVRWFVDCGDDDFLLDVNISFYREMQNAKIPCELRVRDGNHNWDYWHAALKMSLPFVSEGFRR
jgi:enterochelin esterase-like enzyme